LMHTSKATRSSKLPGSSCCQVATVRLIDTATNMRASWRRGRRSAVCS
jgi:hypothetical protein